MATGWIAQLQEPWVKQVTKYASIVLAAMTILETLADLPETLRKNVSALELAGHLLWYLVKIPIEWLALATCLFLIITFCVGWVTLLILIVSLGTIKQHYTFDPLMKPIMAVSAVWAAWLQYKYGLVGGFWHGIHGIDAFITHMLGK